MPQKGRMPVAPAHRAKIVASVAPLLVRLFLHDRTERPNDATVQFIQDLCKAGIHRGEAEDDTLETGKPL